MSALIEIEAAADRLPVEQKEQLLLFLASRLRAAGAKLPEPRQLSREEIPEWIAEDDADMRQFEKLRLANSTLACRCELTAKRSRG